MSSFANDQTPLSAQPMVALSTSNVPRLEEPFQMTTDTVMQESPDLESKDDRHMLCESSDEEDEDSITDTSSVDERRDVPKGLEVHKLPTGLCYDERMRYHSEVNAPTGESVHPEDPRRIYYIHKELCEAGLVEEKGYDVFVEQPLKRIDAREATKEEICLVHTKAHYDFVEKTASMNDEDLIDLSDSPQMDSIYFNALSFYSGKLSAGGSIETCLAVARRNVKNAIAVVRPPGHHAEVQCTMGFCLFNNTCIASRVCQETLGEECRKILILDWDVHHGNGCQKAFYDDPNILYISLHVHMNGNFYPSGPEGDMYHVGTGRGIGKNVNIPWETKGMGDGDYMYAFQNVVMPIAMEFDPDLVIVSAGFDAAAGDELGGCFVSPPMYAHMTHMLMSLANGKVAVCLEGGYNFQAISKSALAVTRTLMGEPPDRLISTQATRRGMAVCQKVRQIQSKYWTCMVPKDNTYGMIDGGERLNDIIRQWQAMHLYDNYHLTELRILRETISESFKSQVLASPNYQSKKNLLVFFHDPPDMATQLSDPLTNSTKPHDTWMIDATQSYVSAALAHSFGLLDVNIPESITITPSVTSSTHPDLDIKPYISRQVSYASTSIDLARKEGEKLAAYLWDNYIEPFDFEHIVFIGAGNAFHAIAKLVSENETLYQRLSCIVSFISEQPVRALTNSNNPWLGQWYREHSRVYVSWDHSLWSREKKSKRYGKVIRAPEEVTGLQKMMLHYKDEVFGYISEVCELDADEVDDDDDETDDEVENEEQDDGERDDQEEGGDNSTDGRERKRDKQRQKRQTGIDKTMEDVVDKHGVQSGNRMAGPNNQLQTRVQNNNTAAVSRNDAASTAASSATAAAAEGGFVVNDNDNNGEVAMQDHPMQDHPMH